MIQTFHIENYKALRDVRIDLTPIHVLIGPNDSGKTSVLEAVAALCRSTDFPLPSCFVGSWSGQMLVSHGAREPLVRLSAAGMAGKTTWEYRLVCRFPGDGRSIVVDDEESTVDGEPWRGNFRGYSETVVRRSSHIGDVNPALVDTARIVHEQLSGVHYYRWVPSMLSLPVAPDSQRRFRMETSGFGLALCLDDILGFDRDAFSRLEKQFCELFPEIRSIKLVSQSAFKSAVDDPEQIPSLQRAEGKGIQLEYTDGSLIPASQVSDGVLLVLAYLAILHTPQPPRIVLTEEPENGIHPRRLSDVMKILRNVVTKQQTTQVLLTTHSPYVVDLFKPEEVSLCAKADDGFATVKQLSANERVLEQSKFFTLGEIWTGEGDEALVGSGTRAARE